VNASEPPVTDLAQAIVAALEPPSTRDADKKKKNKKCCVL
jgi:hypothetical protein